MSEFNTIGDRRAFIKDKLRTHLNGKIVHKDFTKKIKRRCKCAGPCFLNFAWSTLLFEVVEKGL